MMEARIKKTGETVYVIPIMNDDQSIKSYVSCDASFAVDELEIIKTIVPE